MKTISLSEYLSEIKKQLGSSDKETEEVFRKIVLENISFHSNKEMLIYLSEKAINSERHHRSRNFLIEDEETDEIIGFFSLSLKVVDISNLTKKEKKTLLLKGKSPNNITHIPAILIGQVGKNTKINKITGIELIAIVLKKIQTFRSIVGTRMIFLDSVNIPTVIEFYEQFGFIKYGKIIEDKDGNIYQPMALNIEKLN